MSNKNDIRELVSDELLAAWLDGNTSPEENDFVLSRIEPGADNFEVMSISSEAVGITALESVLGLSPVDDWALAGLAAIGLMGAQGDINDPDNPDNPDEKIFDHGDRFEDEPGSITSETDFNAESGEAYTAYTEKTANESTEDGFGYVSGAPGANRDNFTNGRDDMKTYGEEKNYQVHTFDLNIFQGQTSACAVKCQEIILRDYGIVVPQNELEKFAEANGWYDPASGTPMNCVGNILEVYGIEVKQSQGNTIFDLVNELSQGHRVIVGVDSNELWAKSWLEKTVAGLRDRIDPYEADHALIVAGVEVNPRDMNDIKVILTDSGRGDLRVTYDLKEFMGAWEDSNFMMVSTVEPAPYQYNAETQQLEYSQFATEFTPDSIYEFQPVVMPELIAYTPFFDASYLDSIGGSLYEHWVETFGLSPTQVQGIVHEPAWPEFPTFTPPPPLLPDPGYGHDSFLASDYYGDNGGDDSGNLNEA